MSSLSKKGQKNGRQPRLLTDSEREILEEFTDSIHYSSRYADTNYEYRHVMLPKGMLKKIPKDYFDESLGTLRILHEDEWRGLGITQSLGWEHYEIHAPEPHILLFKYDNPLCLYTPAKDFRRPKNYQPPQQ